MCDRVPVFRLASLLLALAIATYGVQAEIGEEEALGVTDGEKETSAGETTGHKSSCSDSWFESLTCNLLGYATIIIPGSFILRMLRNSNLSARSGKLYVTDCTLVLVLICTCTSLVYSLIHVASNSKHFPHARLHKKLYALKLAISTTIILQLAVSILCELIHFPGFY